MLPVTVGILAIQGDVREHVEHVRAVGMDAIEVRTVSELASCSGLIIPGGESTTIGMLMEENGLITGIRERVLGEQFPVYGTCAGLIVLADRVEGKEAPRLRLLDVTVSRNAYGRQVASFEVPVSVRGLGEPPFPAVFIRAPRILNTGSAVTVLAQHDGEPVAVESGCLLASSFHPEVTADTRFHAYFVAKVRRFVAALRA